MTNENKRLSRAKRLPGEKGQSRSVMFLLILLAVSFVGFVVGYKNLKNYWFGDALVFTTPILIDIAPADSVRSVLDKVNDYSSFSNERIDRMALKFFSPNAVVKVGEYEVQGTYSRQQLFDLFAQGKSKQYPVTLIEGHSFKETMTQLGFGERLNAKEALSIISSSVMDNRAKKIMLEHGLSPDSLSLEGWLYPDTYYFDRGAELETILRRAHRLMVTTLLDEWDNRGDIDLPLSSPYEVLIMASLIEKESGHIDEREQIAGVFVRRLQRGMRLQTDPTVIYGMGDAYDGNIRREDLKRDTPYNTYTRDGLPPTPIAMPGLASIRAALNPAEGKALYFVAKGDGSHYFSETLAEHNKAVRKYQILQRRADYRSAPGSQ